MILGMPAGAANHLQSPHVLPLSKVAVKPGLGSTQREPCFLAYLPIRVASAIM